MTWLPARPQPMRSRAEPKLIRKSCGIRKTPVFYMLFGSIARAARCDFAAVTACNMQRSSQKKNQGPFNQSCFTRPSDIFCAQLRQEILHLAKGHTEWVSGVHLFRQPWFTYPQDPAAPVQPRVRCCTPSGVFRRVLTLGSGVVTSKSSETKDTTKLVLVKANARQSTKVIRVTTKVSDISIPIKRSV